MLLFIDNYDSFTYNLVAYCQELGVDTKVICNDELEISSIKKLNPKWILISPGPGNTHDAGISMDVIAEFYKAIPILGVCLGHQCIAKYFGGNIILAPEIMHGKTSIITHNNSSLFKDIKNDFLATRYHSLIVDPNTVPDCLEVTAYADANLATSLRFSAGDREISNEILNDPPGDIMLPGGRKANNQEIMALQHKDYPVFGVQFHPEAVLSQFGHKILNNFLLNY